MSDMSNTEIFRYCKKIVYSYRYLFELIIKKLFLSTKSYPIEQVALGDVESCTIQHRLSAYLNKYGLICQKCIFLKN